MKPKPGADLSPEEFQTLYGLEQQRLEDIVELQDRNNRAGTYLTLEETYLVEIGDLPDPDEDALREYRAEVQMEKLLQPDSSASNSP